VVTTVNGQSLGVLKTTQTAMPL